MRTKRPPGVRTSATLSWGLACILAAGIVSCGGETTVDAPPGTGGGASGGNGSGGSEQGSGGQPGAGGGDSGSGGEAPGSGGIGGGPPGCVDDALAGACLAPLPCTPEERPFGGGDGTAESPYAICNSDHLLAIDDEATGMGKFFVLAASLDLSEVEDFVPIGGGDQWFEGTFDGAGRVLRRLTIDVPGGGDVGLFVRLLPGSLVHDLRLVDFTVRGGLNVGLLAGENQGEIDSVHVSGVVEASERAAGGIVGWNSTNIHRSSSAATVTAPVGAGGLVGAHHGEITESEASGQVSGGEVVGGLVGEGYGTVVDCRCSADVEGVQGVGGLMGSMTGGTVLRAEASGTVTGTGPGVGGLIGMTSSGPTSIVSSRASGDVTGSANLVGGLLGNAVGNNSSTSIEASYSLGQVTGNGDVGGLVGGGIGVTIVDCYALGLVSGTAPIGGLVGSASVTTTAAYYHEGSPASDPPQGIPLSLAAFADEASFVGWDFAETWVMSESLGRPVLAWE